MRRLLIPILLSTALLAPAAAAEARVKRTIKANLDRDGRIERVQLIAKTRPNPYGGTVRIPVRYLRVVDRRGGRLIKRRISAKVERARFAVRDFNRDGRKDIWFNGGAGQGGAAPVWFGLYNWTGGSRRVLWRWSWRRSVVGRRWAGASVESEQYSTDHQGLELVLTEGVLSSGDPNCCPSRLLISVYAWNEHAGRYRLYDRYYARPDEVDPF